MEFVETPSFWCPHVDRAACTNFSLWTVELRPLKNREILPFSFSLSFPFPFLSLPFFPTNCFSFPFFSFVFLFSFSFLLFFFSSHFLFISSPNFLLSLGISLPFPSFLTIWVTEGNFLLIASYHLCGSHISFHFPYFLILFIASNTYVAHCEPSL